MKSYDTYRDAEEQLFERIVLYPDHITRTTHERIGEGFILKNPYENRNSRSNYDYGDAFVRWLLSGERELSAELLEINPWVGRFVDKENLPDNFSSSYAWKVKDQIEDILFILRNEQETRKAYLNILLKEDKIVFYAKTTHEYPCTIGLQFFIREGKLCAVANMRSQNCYAVMPYDVYLFTNLQAYVAGLLGMEDLGFYYHMINNAHIYKGDVRRIKQEL